MEILTIVIGIVLVILAFFIGRYLGARIKDFEIEKHRKDAASRSRSVIGGQFSENISPYLPNFPYLPTECKFLGKPVDFLVFKGSDEKEISEVIFLEVKSGNSKLNTQERKLKSAIDSGNVRFEEYRIPKEVTKKKD